MEVEQMLSLRQHQALTCLSYLQHCAVQKQTITYESLAIILGMPSKGNAMVSAISRTLYDVFNFCEKAQLPHLTVLVVRKSGKDVGLPGSGFWKVYLKEDNPSLGLRVEETEKLTGECYRMFDGFAKGE